MRDKTDSTATPGVNVSDDKMLDLLARAEPEGIEMLYDRYSGLAYTLALRVVNDSATAEDVVQEAFLSIWRRASTYRSDRGSLRTWVCSIVHHRALDRLRGRAGRARHDVALEHAPIEATSVSDTWDQVADEIERAEIRTALTELSVEQRETIELAYFGGYSQTEISELMHVPLGTVKGRTRLALRKLRGVLEFRLAEGMA
ncbi:MAG: sigma-70 family RNA polymerase sigma factor [Candidatus Dormibacteraeota bacterium]|uniref:Sigma-70 family RNA polymerase sigma factor n=1 Tax=Candidatus Aeolococcus gillhamiae TaxID=3127015 RepID=A0A934N5G2_9BACT|nr:sigma-70 family RNA polymerase sigma factor [Candidatus Dormibacteraeota bacterium]